jgi:serine/threonine-protein kinase
MLGRYALLEQVGSGGMAVVYRGRDTALDREVAVKLLHPHLAAAPESRARFSREARAVARLSHPGIVEIYDYAGDGAPESYLVTEFVRGRTLRAFASEVGFGFPELGMLVGRALADALVHAHSAGVIHRDLKPENVLVDEGERPAVKLADFGIARILASDERMTMTGALVGSPHHMPPEVVEGRDADVRSDVFSLGTILYWLATGKLPFAASNPTAILRRVLQGEFEDPRTADPRVADPLAELIVRCLKLDPLERPASAAEVRDALDRVLQEVGIDRPAEELAAFLRAPVATGSVLRERAIAALVARGDAAAAEGATARALRSYGRVLAIDPDNAEVPAKLALLSRRRRARRAALWGGGTAALAVLAAALAWVTSGSTPSLPPSPVPPSGATAVQRPPDAIRDNPAVATHPAPQLAAAPRTAPAAGAGPTDGPQASVAPRDGSRAPARPPSVAAAGHAPLSVYVRPYAQRALLDGVEVARGQQLVRFDIPPGLHVIQIEHACCNPLVKQITAEEAARHGELRVPLEPRPARLRVEGDPATQVFIDGRLLGTAGESRRAPFAIGLPRGENPYESTARLVLELAGAPAREIHVRLRAGADVTVAAPEPEVSP